MTGGRSHRVKETREIRHSPLVHRLDGGRERVALLPSFPEEVREHLFVGLPRALRCGRLRGTVRRREKDGKR